ncbi:MAG: LPS assembly lipoprotein LptE [Planctomycetales bacterium]
MYPNHIRTVHVPVFASDSLRPGLGPWLTEAVIKQIEQTTDYKVVSRNKADTVLEGLVLPVTKQVSVTTINDDLREVDMTMQIQVRWIDSQGELVYPEMVIPLPVALADVRSTSGQVTEVGHSTLSAEQAVVEQLATQIVAMMESPW